MSKLTINTSASTEAKTPAPKADPALVTGPSGRTYKLQKLSPLKRMQVFEAIGSELSTNMAFLTYALVAYSVVSIDGDETLPKGTVNNLKAIVSRIDEDWDAVNEGLAALTPRPKSDDEDEAALLKN